MSDSQANKQVICEVLMEKAKEDKDIFVICSDSKGSGSMTAFADMYPEQFVEVGIAEQNLVSMAAGMAKCGKKVFAVSPASFLTARSYEQIKVDAAYSGANVKLIGISGGVSYGALGMTHHSLQDIAALSAVPGLEIYIPSDRHQTRYLTELLLDSSQPAYVRVGRNAVGDIYSESDGFVGKKAVVHGEYSDSDLVIVACGEMVLEALKAGRRLNETGVRTCVLDVFCLKPLDEETILKTCSRARAVITVEEHSGYGGLGSMICRLLSGHQPKPVIVMAMPDSPVIAGKSREIFEYYGLTADGIASQACRLLDRVK